MGRRYRPFATSADTVAVEMVLQKLGINSLLDQITTKGESVSRKDSDMSRPKRRAQQSEPQLILSQAEVERRALLVSFPAEQRSGITEARNHKSQRRSFALLRATDLLVYVTAIVTASGSLIYLISCICGEPQGFYVRGFITHVYP